MEWLTVDGNGQIDCEDAVKIEMYDHEEFLSAAEMRVMW